MDEKREIDVLIEKQKEIISRAMKLKVFTDYDFSRLINALGALERLQKEDSRGC